MTTRKKTPSVRIARPKGRQFQIRYTDPKSGKEIRLSVGSRDEQAAQDLKADIEAKLHLELPVNRSRRVGAGEQMYWEDFREEYSRLKVATFKSEKSKQDAESRLDIAERIISPNRLGDMVTSQTLSRLQAELLAGAGQPENRKSKGYRAASTVENYMKTVLAAINWAYEMGWVKDPIRFKPMTAVKEAKNDPVTLDEFDLMLEAIDTIRAKDADAWRFLLRGLWETGLRLGEALNLSWDDSKSIRPFRDRDGFVVLRIPANQQKNKREQTIATTPAFAELLDEVPVDERTGPIFKLRRVDGKGWLTNAEHISRVISDIGADVEKSAHDLRRGFGQRMADAGLPARELQLIMRHSSFETTQAYYLKSNAAESSRRIASYLGTVEKVYPEMSSKSPVEDKSQDAKECETR